MAHTKLIARHMIPTLRFTTLFLMWRASQVACQGSAHDAYGEVFEPGYDSVARTSTTIIGAATDARDLGGSNGQQQTHTTKDSRNAEARYGGVHDAGYESPPLTKVATTTLARETENDANERQVPAHQVASADRSQKHVAAGYDGVTDAGYNAPPTKVSTTTRSASNPGTAATAVAKAESDDRSQKRTEDDYGGVDDAGYGSGSETLATTLETTWAPTSTQQFRKARLGEGSGAATTTAWPITSFLATTVAQQVQGKAYDFYGGVDEPGYVSATSATTTSSMKSNSVALGSFSAVGVLASCCTLLCLACCAGGLWRSLSKKTRQLGYERVNQERSQSRDSSKFKTAYEWDKESLNGKKVGHWPDFCRAASQFYPDVGPDYLYSREEFLRVRDSGSVPLAGEDIFKTRVWQE